MELSWNFSFLFSSLNFFMVFIFSLDSCILKQFSLCFPRKYMYMFLRSSTQQPSINKKNHLVSFFFFLFKTKTSIKENWKIREESNNSLFPSIIFLYPPVFLVKSMVKWLPFKSSFFNVIYTHTYISCYC